MSQWLPSTADKQDVYPESDSLSSLSSSFFSSSSSSSSESPPLPVKRDRPAKTIAKTPRKSVASADARRGRFGRGGVDISRRTDPLTGEETGTKRDDVWDMDNAYANISKITHGLKHLETIGRIAAGAELTLKDDDAFIVEGMKSIFSSLSVHATIRDKMAYFLERVNGLISLVGFPYGYKEGTEFVLKIRAFLVLGIDASSASNAVDVLKCKDDYIKLSKGKWLDHTRFSAEAVSIHRGIAEICYKMIRLMAVTSLFK